MSDRSQQLRLFGRTPVDRDSRNVMLFFVYIVKDNTLILNRYDIFYVLCVRRLLVMTWGLGKFGAKQATIL